MGIPKRALTRFIPADAVIVEAGAHRGFDTVQFARLWPEGTIHAFEPVPEKYDPFEVATNTSPLVPRVKVARSSLPSLLKSPTAGISLPKQNAPCHFQPVPTKLDPFEVAT